MPALPSSHSRRQFIGQCCATVGATGLLSALAQLRLIGAAAQPAPAIDPATGQAVADFKALVCLFLHGGNDANNLIVPTGTAEYAAYTAARGGLALPREALLGINPRNGDGRTWGLHPAGPQLQALFASGQLALLANVGTLVVPTTKAQFNARSVPLPWQLFSHYDQQVQWQNSVADNPCQTGWGGRMADLSHAFNANDAISMSISLAGRNLFQTGNTVAQYNVNPAGVVQLQEPAGTNGDARLRAMQALMSPPDASLLETAFAGTTRGSIANASRVAAALAAAPNLTTVFPTTSLGRQLQMIARLIQIAPQLGLKRQVFFAQALGFDLHDSQVDPANRIAGSHANLLADLGAGLLALRNATVELGVPNQVTTFTASDFGRTYTTNGDGSDHGWGSHHLVMGVAVQGGAIYGAMPDLTVNGPDDTGGGRWIPTTSVDEYSATLARWFGVSESDLPLVLPNIGRFPRPNLGFMRPA